MTIELCRQCSHKSCIVCKGQRPGRPTAVSGNDIWSNSICTSYTSINKHDAAIAQTRCCHCAISMHVQASGPTYSWFPFKCLSGQREPFSTKRQSVQLHPEWALIECKGLLGSAVTTSTSSLYIVLQGYRNSDKPAAIQEYKAIPFPVRRTSAKHS